MAEAKLPIVDGQLDFHLKVAKRKVRAVAYEDGFTLQIEHSDLAHTLTTQRGSPRVFKNLTTVATFLKDRGVKRFTVILEQRSSDEKAAKSSVKVTAKADTGAKAKSTSRRGDRSLSFDRE
ncbi:hypothetical protein ACF8EF_17045 [Pseudomonas sp. zjy_15]|uniref:hypothetical protein n=1 Tax=Pseudomonas sp. zjy_15 TaxID=3367265 RepID=UPI00370BF7AC